MKSILYKKLLFFTSWILIGFFHVSCFGGLSKEYPSKKYYLISVDHSKFGNLNKKFPYIKVNKFKISNLYESKNFIYRHSEVGYESDFYNEFLVFPVSNITEIFSRWVDQAELGQVTPNAFDNEKLYVLTGNIIALYGDFKDPKSPNAVMEIDIYIQRASDNWIVYRKRLEQRVPIPKAEAEELVKGWNLGLQNILKNLEIDLAKLVLK